MVQSPILSMGTGLAISNKLLAAHSGFALSDGTKTEQTVIFSDYREGAAEVAAGVEAEHFLKHIRQLLIQALIENQNQPSQSTLLNAFSNKTNFTEVEKLAQKWIAENFSEGHGEALRAHVAKIQLSPTVTKRLDEILSRIMLGPESIPWSVLITRIRNSLIEKGINPRGPKPSMQKHDDISGGIFTQIFPLLSQALKPKI